MVWVVKNKIEEKNMTHKDLSDLLGISQKHLSEMLNGHKNITYDLSLRMEKILGFDEGFILKSIHIQKMLDSDYTESEQEIASFLKETEEYKLLSSVSLKMKVKNSAFFVNGMDNYSRYISQRGSNEIHYMKYKNKALSHFWIYLMEKMCGEHLPKGNFKKSVGSTVINKVLDIYASGASIDIKIDKIKNTLSEHGIFLGNGSAISGAYLHGVHIKKGHHHYIFLSDYNKNFCYYINSLIHELLHIYLPDDLANDENYVINNSLNVIDRYLSKKKITNTELNDFVNIFKKDQDDKYETFNSLKRKESYLNFNNLEEMLKHI